MDKLLEDKTMFTKEYISIIKKFYYKNYMLKDKQNDIIKCQNWMTQNNINYLIPYKKSLVPKSTICLE